MKICSKCKIEKSYNEYYKNKSSKDGYRNDCKSCKKEFTKKNYENNHEEYLERNRKYHENNKEKINTKKREYYEDNFEKISERQKKYRNSNIDKLKKIRKEYYKNTVEKRKKYIQEYRKNNIYKVNAYARKYRTMRKKFTKNQYFTAYQRRQLLERDGWFCKHCKIEVHDKVIPLKLMTEKEKLSKACADHIIPLAKNGETTLGNGQILCWSCNCKKGNRLEEELDYLSEKNISV